MRISTTACYGLQLLICLAERQESQPLSATELAEHTGIPEKFTRKILHSLSSAGIVRSQRGIAGGYFLDAAPDSITLACIIRAVEGGISPPAQTLGSSAAFAASDIWKQAAQSLEDALKEYTLQSVIEISHFQGTPSLIENPLQQGERVATNNQELGEIHAKKTSLGRQRSRKPSKTSGGTSTT